MNGFNDIKTRNELAEFLDIPIRKLTYVLYKKGIENYYTSFEIPKKSCGVRQINAPQGDLKEIQKKLANALENFQTEYIKENQIQAKVSHAFEKKKGIITNSAIHRYKRVVLNLDLENFFESFHFGRVRGFFEKNRNFCFPIEVATILAQLACYKGSLPQGAPSSPIITNLICNILDMRLLKTARKYKLDYTRYADDLTFSTNDKRFLEDREKFLDEVIEVIKKSGFMLNTKKTRLSLNNSRQMVTGLVVNKKINVPRDYYKKTRAMANSLYKEGEFKIDDLQGTINQLEGRFSFINQIDWYNNRNDDKQHSFRKLCSREEQYQRFLFYRYFFFNSKPLIVTEGKTDIAYVKAALKARYKEYPNLVRKTKDGFEFKISFLRRTKRLDYFLGIVQDGADAMKNIFNCYSEKGQPVNLSEYFKKKYNLQPLYPVILIFDNEQKSDRPLKKFLNHIGQKELLAVKQYGRVIENLFVLTNPLIGDKTECEIEDLFDESVLSHTIGGKTFSRDKNADSEKNYGKKIFSDYIAKNFEEINFDNFKPLLNDLGKILKEFKEKKE